MKGITNVTARGLARFAPSITGFVMIAATACAVSQNVRPQPSMIQSPAIIPAPVKTDLSGGMVALNEKSVIGYTGGDNAKAEAEKLATALRTATGLPLPVKPAGENATGILLALDPSANSGKEGYQLTAAGTSVRITAADCAGLFYGGQTLRQLMPVINFKAPAQSGMKWQVPSCQIKDHPRFSWRGMHLDVGRNFFSAEEVKKFIDLLAFHKMNVLHWHLTEDQGWRIEIKKYPKLTSVGAWRDRIGFGLDPKTSSRVAPDGRYGGFYTQEQIRDVVAYAAARHITIVPEIELPGHALAALAAYPEFSCTGGPFKIGYNAGVYDDVFCAGKESTFTFLEDVLTEVTELFPGAFVHVGGDECPKGRWNKCPDCQKRIKDNNLKNVHELQSYVIKRVEKFLAGKGKRLIGWDEILEGGLAPGAAVMSWRGTNGGIHAAKAGHDVVMSPNSHCYFDMQQAPGEPGRPRVIDLKTVYSYEPIPAQLPADKHQHILGCQANLWSEYIPNYRHLEMMAAPRMCALAEVAWSEPAKRNWDDFLRRMDVQYHRMGYMDVNFRFPVGISFKTEAGQVSIIPESSSAVIRYTTDGSDPLETSPCYSEPLKIAGSSTIKARVIRPGGIPGPFFTCYAGRPAGKITTSMGTYKTNSPNLAYDGSTASFYWTGKPPKAGDTVTLTLDQPFAAKKVIIITGNAGDRDTLKAGILEISTDGTNFRKTADFVNGTVTAEINETVQAVRLKVVSQSDWLAVKEIVVQ